MAEVKQPEDKSYFILPDLGEGVHEAELIKWRVKPGEAVDEYQTLAEMETDKALVEVPAPWAGTVGDLRHQEGEIVNVGDVLLTFESAGDSSGGSAAAESQQSAPRELEEQAAEGEREDAGTVVGAMGEELNISERFARRRDTENGAASQRKALATPAVRRIARELGVDINQVPGTGRGGRVTASDVQNFASGQAGARSTTARGAAPAATAPQQAAAPDVAISRDGVSERIAMRGVRRKIAQSLHQSVNTAVHFTVVDDADVTALDRKRKEYAGVLGRKLSFLPFVITAACKALRQHPSLNANVDDANEEILIKSAINLGIAVDTEHGLMVPVMEGADQKSIVEIGDTVTELAAGCRNRTIDRGRLTGGTFTISNVGSYGGLYATPIINYPEVAILAAGRVREQVLARDGAIFAGKVMPLSLSCDHRVVDGAEGARFLNTVVKLLEHPDDLLQS